MIFFDKLCSYLEQYTNTTRNISGKWQDESSWKGGRIYMEQVERMEQIDGYNKTYGHDDDDGTKITTGWSIFAWKEQGENFGHKSFDLEHNGIT